MPNRWASGMKSPFPVLLLEALWDALSESRHELPQSLASLGFFRWSITRKSNAKRIQPACDGAKYITPLMIYSVLYFAVNPGAPSQ